MNVRTVLLLQPPHLLPTLFPSPFSSEPPRLPALLLLLMALFLLLLRLLLLLFSLGN